MILSKNIIFFALVQIFCKVFLLFFSSNLLAKQGPYNFEGFVIAQSPISFLKINSSKSFVKEINDFIFLSVYDLTLIFVGILLTLYIIWFFNKPNQKKPELPGFKLINFTGKYNFIPLKSESQTLEFLEDHEISKGYRLSANLNRVILTPNKNTFLLEDKNYKNALLINRRRLHRKLLFHNDLLDIGEIVLIYSNDLFVDKNIQNGELLNYAQIFQSTKPRGPVQKGVPILQVSGGKQEIILSRNLNTIGTSKTNDVVVKSSEIASRHAKIYKVGESWKIQNLQNNENTFVNGRRIDQRFLKEGDEIAVGDFIFRFSTMKSKIKRIRKFKKESKISSV